MLTERPHHVMPWTYTQEEPILIMASGIDRFDSSPDIYHWSDLLYHITLPLPLCTCVCKHSLTRKGEYSRLSYELWMNTYARTSYYKDGYPEGHPADIGHMEVDLANTGESLSIHQISYIL